MGLVPESLYWSLWRCCIDAELLMNVSSSCVLRRLLLSSSKDQCFPSKIMFSPEQFFIDCSLQLWPFVRLHCATLSSLHEPRFWFLLGGLMASGFLWSFDSSIWSESDFVSGLICGLRLGCLFVCVFLGLDYYACVGRCAYLWSVSCGEIRENICLSLSFLHDRLLFLDVDFCD